MKILITCFKLNEYSGVELFTLDLAKELKNKGHEVRVFSMILGKIAGKIKALGIPVTDDILDWKDQKFDMIHAQHSVTAVVVRSVFPESRLILMVHGVAPDLEQPFRIDFGVDHYIAVSENSKNYIATRYNVPRENIDVVGNFIDTEKFSAKVPANKEPKNLLVISNHYQDDVRQIIESVCSEKGIAVFHAGLPENPVKNIEEYINRSDIVVAIGRSALEAMACGRNVIIYDVFGGDGFVDENNFFELEKMNFSGLLHKRQYNREEFWAELEKYDSTVGSKLRELVKEEYSKEKTIEEFEEIYKKTMAQNPANNFRRIPLEIFAKSKAKNFQENNISQFVGSDNFWAEVEKYGSADHLREEVDNLMTKHIWKKRFFISEFIAEDKRPGRLIQMGIRIYRKNGFLRLLSRTIFFFKKYGKKLLGVR